MQPGLLVVQKAVPEADPGDGQRQSREVAFYNGGKSVKNRYEIGMLESPSPRSKVQSPT